MTEIPNSGFLSSIEIEVTNYGCECEENQPMCDSCSQGPFNTLMEVDLTDE